MILAKPGTVKKRCDAINFEYISGAVLIFSEQFSGVISEPVKYLFFRRFALRGQHDSIETLNKKWKKYQVKDKLKLQIKEKIIA